MSIKKALTGTIVAVIATGHISAAIAETPFDAAYSNPEMALWNVATERLPDFLLEADVQFLSQEELDQVRGEGVPSWMVSWAIKQVTKRLGTSTGNKLGGLLTSSTPPTYDDYRKVFGPKTSRVLSLLPYPLRPQIAG